MKCSLHRFQDIKLIFVRLFMIAILMCVEGECLSPNKHVKAMLTDFDYLVGQLYVQQCTFVEIGEGFCTLFIELPIDVGGKKPLLRQMFFGHCQCSEFRSWQLCSHQLSQQRPDDCTFDEGGTCSGTSARVHRRLCDVTGMSQWNPQCNCSLPLAGLSQDILCGFRTCFAHPLPASICLPRTVCGTAKCDVNLNGALYSVKCDRHCKQHQPFCERTGPATSKKRKVSSQWSDWKPTSCSDKSNIQQYEAECLDSCQQPAFDCLGPGILCCGKEEVDCICEVKQEEDRLRAFRYTISFPTSSDSPDHNSVKVRSARFKLHPKVWHRFMDLTGKDDSSDSLFSDHRAQRRKSQQHSLLESGHVTEGRDFVFQHISKLVNSDRQQPNVVSTYQTVGTKIQAPPPQSVLNFIENISKPLSNSLQRDGNLTNNIVNPLNPSTNILITPNLQQHSFVNNSSVNAKSGNDFDQRSESYSVKKDQSDSHFTSVTKPVIPTKTEKNHTKKVMVTEKNLMNINVEYEKPTVDGSSENSKLYNKVTQDKNKEPDEKMKPKSDGQDLNKPFTNNGKTSQLIDKGTLQNNKSLIDDNKKSNNKKISKEFKNTKAYSTVHEPNSSPLFKANEDTAQSQNTNDSEQNHTLADERKEVDIKNTGHQIDSDVEKSKVLESTFETNKINDHENNSQNNEFVRKEQKQKLTNGKKEMDSDLASVQETPRKIQGEKFIDNRTIINNQISKTEKPSQLLSSLGFQRESFLNTSPKRTTNKQIAVDSLKNMKTGQRNYTGVEHLSKIDSNTEKTSEDLKNEKKNNGPISLEKLTYINDSVNSEINNKNVVEHEAKQSTTEAAIFFSDIDNLLPNPTTEIQNATGYLTSYTNSNSMKQVNLTKDSMLIEQSLVEKGKKLVEPKEIFMDQKDALRTAANLNPILPVDDNKISQNNLYDEPEPILKDLDKENVDDNMAEALNKMVGLKQSPEKTFWTESKKQAETLHPDEKNKYIFQSLSKSVTKHSEGHPMQNKARLVHSKSKKKMSQA